MDLQQLKYILALAEELNFNRAAKKVGISQPTLSQQIKKLENELGEPLFERSPAQVRLTPAGENFLPHIRSSLEQIRLGVDTLKKDQGEITGTVKLAFIPTIGPYIIPQTLKKIKKLAPNLTLKLYEETTSELVKHLKEGKFDLGLLALPIDDASLVNRTLCHEEFLLAVSKEHPMAHQKMINLKDIQNQSLLILKEGHCFRDQALDFCHSNQTNTQLIFEGSSLVSVLNLVQANEGITLVPKMVASSNSYPDLKFIPFKGDTPQREIGLIWRMSMPMNKEKQFILNTLENIL